MTLAAAFTPGMSGCATILSASSLAALLLAACGWSTDRPVLTPTERTGQRKLILFGDALSGSEGVLGIRESITKLEATPFDGLVMDLGLANRVWRPVRLDAAAIAAQVEVVKGTPFRRLTDNFQQVTTDPGGIDWFDDAAFAVIAENAGVAAAIAKQAGLRGLFMDVEQYTAPQFTFAGQPIGRTFAEHESEARRRGRAVMAAMGAAYPDLTLLLAFAYGETFRMACLEGEPLESQPYSLLPAFVDGLLEAKAEARLPAVIVDAHLSSYPNKIPEGFTVFRNLVRFDWTGMTQSWRPGITTHLYERGLQSWPASPILRCSNEVLARVARNLPVGFGIMVDYGHWDRGFALDPAGFAGNHFTPTELESSLGAALRHADRYVWVYSETATFGARPRPLVPPEYVRAVERARRQVGP